MKDGGIELDPEVCVFRLRVWTNVLFVSDCSFNEACIQKPGTFWSLIFLQRLRRRLVGR